ncbi:MULTISPECIES: Rha family transcriptional regulator [Hungatella]|mgnify:CR=1 FL=1|jgi:Rha family phage regulatory protein|uniref:Rha family transcriptional regulator n=1 Tax=Hungatella TaxID=1649459 RepID=UPI0011DE0954|nr:Rha family transcriptional regulator [Hungatella hathewayi]
MLVEIKKMNREEVVTCTSLDIAETFEKEHKNVLKDIRELECSEEFGRLNFEQSYYINSQNKKQPLYYMTKDGFTLLAMGYSGEKAMRFKEAYIRQFNAMEKALIGKMKEREKGIAVRQALTNTLQRSQENERMHGHAYSTYTNAIYKAVFGKNAKQLREDYGIGSQDNLRDRFSVEELSAVQSMEMLVSGLINCGWGYEKIRDFIQENSVKQLAG